MDMPNQRMNSNRFCLFHFFFGLCVKWEHTPHEVGGSSNVGGRRWWNVVVVVVGVLMVEVLMVEVLMVEVGGGAVG